MKELQKLTDMLGLEIIVHSVVYICIAFVLVKLVNKAFDKDKVANMIHMKFIKNALVTIIWVIAGCTVAGQFSGVSKLASTILAGSGILAAIIGLAAQESFSNIFSGLFISIFKPFNIGDRISIVGDSTAGFVEDITLRHTIIRTYTNVSVIIPNSIIASSKIENSTYTKGCSYPIEVDIAYEDKEKRHRAMEIMEEVVINHPKFYDMRSDEAKVLGVKPAQALCTELGDSGIHMKILMWTEEFSDNAEACSECRMKILDRLEEEGIEIPYNKIELIK